MHGDQIQVLGQNQVRINMIQQEQNICKDSPHQPQQKDHESLQLSKMQTYDSLVPLTRFSNQTVRTHLLSQLMLQAQCQRPGWSIAAVLVGLVSQASN